jgi:tetratricopeptide (TPR) repeat protein
VYGFQGNYQTALEASRQALQLAPDVVSSYWNLGFNLLALQHFTEARQIMQEALVRKLDDLPLRSALYALAFFDADSQGMAEQAAWFGKNPDNETYGLTLQSDSEAYRGHLHSARELTNRARDSAIHADRKETGAIWVDNAALREAALGNVTQARQSATEALRLSSSTRGVQVEAALAVSIAGDTASAERLSEKISKAFPLDTQVQFLWLPTIRAQVALDKRNPSAALRKLQAAAPIELGQIQFLANISCLEPIYVRANVFLAAGEGRAAAAEFQKILDHSGIVWNCWTGALARLGVARANALQARTSHGADSDAARVRALAAYNDFLTLWKDADPDIPILMQAKAEYAKLQ